MNASASFCKVMVLCGLSLALLAPQRGAAQSIDDAIRTASTGIGVGARALGMGDAYTGIASDYSALYWNPAGLAQATFGEFSGGLSYLSSKDQGSYYGAQTPLTSNVTNLNALGLVYPIPVRRGSLVIAFGFDRQAAFTSGLSFSGFNPNSSIVQTMIADPASDQADLAYRLFLSDTAGAGYFSPIRNRVTQSGVVTESGGLNNWSVGGAVDVAKNLSLGATLTFVAGSYHYERRYTEQAAQGVYAFPYDMNQLTLNDLIDDDISGVNAKFGLMYRVPDKFRFGIAVKTPTAFSIKESYSTTGSSTFYTADNTGNNAYGPYAYPGSIDYDIHTPWILSGGASVILRDLVLAADVDYIDWTSLEFANTVQGLLDENLDIKTSLRAVANYRFGAEYDFHDLGVRLRAGYMVNTSPYEGDPSSFNQKFVTGGLGIMLGESSMLDLAYANGWWKTFRVNYDDPTARVDEKITASNFLLTFAHRF